MGNGSDALNDMPGTINVSTKVRRLIKSVDSYAALKATKADKVFIRDASVGGEFVISTDQASAANNVTRITRDDGVIMDRVWDGKNFYADWVPMSTTIGALGTTSTTYTGDKIRYAALLCGNNGTIHLTEGAEYLVNLPINLQSHRLIGYGSTIKRGPQISALTTAQTEIGSNVITMADTSAFTVGSLCLAVLTPGTLGGHAMYATSGGGFFISSKTATTLTLSANVVKTVPIGTKIVIYDNMLFQLSSDVPGKIEGVTFDGNVSEHSDVLDWAVGWLCNVHYCRIDRCIFQNQANECIAIGSGEVTNCNASALWGSFVHTSTASDKTPYGLLVANNYCANVNTKNSGHDEGVITFSNKSRNIRIRDCVFDNTGYTRGQGVFGAQTTSTSTDDDGNFFANNVVAKNFGSIMAVSTSGALLDYDNLSIENCVFENCKSLTVGTIGTPGKTPVVKRFMCQNNRFVNCYAIVGLVRDFTWANNTLIWQVGGTGCYAGSHATTFASLPTTRVGGSALANGDFAYLDATDGANLKGVYIRASGAWVYSATETEKLPVNTVYACLQVSDCGLVKITGGAIIGPEFVSETQFTKGIWLRTTVPLKTEVGTSTTAYMSDVLVADIDIINWQYGVVNGGSAHWAVTPSYNVAGWRFSNVNVWPIKETRYPYVIGLEVIAGTMATNCQVYMPSTAIYTGGCGIIAKGPLDKTKNVGGIVQNCYVPYAAGTADTIRLGRITDVAQVNDNCVAINNIIGKAVALAGTHDSIQEGNKVLATEMTGYTAGELPIHRAVGTNSTLY